MEHEWSGGWATIQTILELLWTAISSSPRFQRLALSLHRASKMRLEVLNARDIELNPVCCRMMLGTTAHSRYLQGFRAA